jgi:hypothetical protein
MTCKEGRKMLIFRGVILDRMKKIEIKKKSCSKVIHRCFETFVVWSSIIYFGIQNLCLKSDM